MWVSPIAKKKAAPTEVAAAVAAALPPLFKAEKLTLPRSEAKKILRYAGTLSLSQTAWTQRWLEQRVREQSLPPQLARDDAFAQILSFLSPQNAAAMLAEIRADFQRTLPVETPEVDEFAFLLDLATEACHEHLSPPQSSSRSNQTQVDGHESE